MKRRLVLVALAAMSASAQVIVSVSNDCHMWNMLPAEGVNAPRAWYLAGLLHGMRVAPTETRVSFTPVGAFSNDMENGITEICKAPENANVDLLHALEIFKAKLNGESQEQVEGRLRGARKIAADSAAKESKK
jgi:hypothetical protein